MKNKKLIAAVIGFLLLALGYVQTQLNAPDEPAPAPAPAPIAADAGV